MRHLLATIAVLALVLAFGGATTAQVASPEPTASPPPVPLEVEPVTKPLPVADYWGQWSLHKEASTGRLDQATSNARNAADRKRARFYRDASAVNKDELAWLSNHQPRECYAIEYEVWRAATKDLHRIHRKAARFAKAGDKPGLRRTLKQQKAAVRLRNTAHSAFSDCPDLSVPAIQRSTASPIVGRWVTTKDYVDGDGRHFILRIHSEVSPNGNLLARDK